MQENVLLYSKFCELNELICLVCSVDENEKHNRSAPSNFHHKILKCRILHVSRRLISSNDEILASPDDGSNLKIFVIFNRNIANNEKFIELIHEINLKIINISAVDLPTYKVCLKYTLIVKMSPLWNHIRNDILVKGRDFLHHSTSLDAVEFNVLVFESAVVISIRCTMINLALIKNKDLQLEVSQQTIGYYNDVPGYSTQEAFSIDQQILVLPRLTRGQIKSVNREIPKTSLFDNYKELKRHWKNCYGYRLPDDDTEIVYYEVDFGYKDSKLFTYPSICLAKNFTMNTPSQQSISEIIESFKTDVNQKLSHILGHSVSFDKLELERVEDLDDYCSPDNVQFLSMDKILYHNRISINNCKPLIREENDKIRDEEVESVDQKNHINAENNITKDSFSETNISLSQTVTSDNESGVNAGTPKKQKMSKNDKIKTCDNMIKK